ncbi:MFS transporter [Actinomyces faecalis]|uniref:MFS transporter n=1 Tax=Actinomyces faecalis TaxID=2722820 RepID=UPI0015537764|nr:MFS transporter [Actinomyces faecalis]
MTSPSPAAATSRPGRRQHAPSLVKARIAVYLTFFANGVGFSNLVPRYPEVLEHLGITKAAFGQALMFSSIGALVAGLAASWFISRFTSARVASLGMIVLGLGLLGAAASDSWLILALCMAWAGGADAIIDVAQNAHGLRVERRWGSSIITSFHAAWSLGAVVGATLGQAMAGWGVEIRLHMLGVLVLLTVVSTAASRWMIKGPDSDDRDPVTVPSAGSASAPAVVDLDDAAVVPARASRLVTVAVIIVLGLMCAAAMFPEDVTANWSSLLLTEQEAPVSMRGLGLVALQTTMIIGRLLGDAVIDRLGARAVIGGGGVLVAAGMGLALLLDSVTGTVVGMVVAGAGCAVAVPVAYAAADDVPGLRPGMGLTIVSWLARCIMLVSPPIVGWFADAFGTWVALVYGLLGGAIMALSWPVLRKGRRSDAISAQGAAEA